MPKAAMSDSEFISQWTSLGNAASFSKAHGMAERVVNQRRKRLETKLGLRLLTRPTPGYESRTPIQNIDAGWTYPRQKDLWLHEGVAVVFSDAHYWPGEPSVAHKALLSVIKDTKPRVIFANGDIFDGVSVSRHDPFGWSSRPNVKQELEACIERMGEVEQVAPNGCQLLWNVGNHDLRFERTLAAKVPEFVGMEMMRLADHFPAWEFQWSTMVNGKEPHPVMVKHRYASGIHAGYNNSLKGGLSIVTGHTHQLESKPWGDYRGRRWGVQTGTLADHHGPQFEYTENAPSPACSGFAVLTFREGRMLPPELCEVLDDTAYFRGKAL
jgi:hypothetical protein